MTGRTCNDYCAGSGLVCTGAWEEVNEDCNVKEDWTCGQVYPGTSDLICECALAMTTTIATAVTTATVTATTTETATSYQAVCAALPDVEQYCSADGCKVLAGGMTGRTCNDYCAGSGLVCTGAWEEVNEDCNVKEDWTCGQAYPRTSDLICECALTGTPAPTCTPNDGDPWATGSKVPCCTELQECFGDHAGDGRWFYKCLPECQSTTPAPIDPTGSIKFFVWNVHYQNRNTWRIADIIRPNNPDIIGLNEFTATGQSLETNLNQMISGRDYAMQPGWTHFAGFGTYILYDKNKFDGIEGGASSVSCPGTRGGNRAANWAVLREKSSQKLLITGGIHLSYCSGGCDWTHECELGKMYDRFEEMLRKYPGTPTVWMGDMNRGRWDRVIQNVMAGKLGDRNVFPVEDLGQSQSRTYYRGGIIDFIFGEARAFSRVDGGSTGQGTPNQWLNSADHFPVFASVQWAH